MASPSLSDSKYSTLNKYAVLAYSGITTVSTTTITGGDYGIFPNAATYITGDYVGTMNNIDANLAQTQLGYLVTDLNDYTQGLTEIALGASETTRTILPNRSYKSGSNINFTTNSTITFDAQNNSNAYFFITAVSDIDLNNVTAIHLINQAKSSNIFWIAGTAITFTGTPPSPIYGVLIAHSKIDFDNSSTVNGRLYAQTENVIFKGTGFAVNASTPIPPTPTPTPVVCYAEGTLLLTSRGLIPIERIRVGQELVSKGEITKRHLKAYPGVELVRWVSKFKVDKMNADSRPICIEKNALGKNQPFQDLYVSPGHSIFVNDQMVLAKRLVNGVNIYPDMHAEEVTYYHVECARHSAILANGVVSESYLESNNRHVFENKTKPPKINSFLSNYVNQSFKK